MRFERIQKLMPRAQSRGHSKRTSAYAAGRPKTSAIRVEEVETIIEFRK
jgi:hypothetical protein